MNKTLRILFVFLCLFVLSLPCSSVLKECRKIDSCTCVFPSGLGVNLSALNKETVWLNTTFATHNVSFYFHPCSNLPFGNHTGIDDCTRGTSVCLFNETTKKYENLGRVEEMTFLSVGMEEPPAVQFKHGTITTAILLQCVYNKESNLTAFEAPNNNVTHQLHLSSSAVCPVEVTDKPMKDVPNEGLSVGSVLVIIFFVFTTLYFVGGAIALKFLRGAEGREMIPNYDFWSDLPNLMRDGLHFTLNGCQTNPSYDRI